MSNTPELKLPPFIQTEVEQRLFTDLLTIKIEPSKAYNVSTTVLTFLVHYFKTADVHYATKMAHPHKNNTYEKVPEKNIEAIFGTQSAYYAVIHYIYEAIKKLKRDGYLKLSGTVINRKSINKQWLDWFLKEETLFEYPPINASINFYKTTPTAFTNNDAHKFYIDPSDITTAKDDLVVDKDNKKLSKKQKQKELSTTRDQAYPIRPLTPDELINNSIKEMPHIAGLHRSFENLSDEEVRKAVIGIHTTNLHFIALDDESKTADRIKASETVLKLVGAFEIDNKQKSEALKTAFENEDVKAIIQAIKEKNIFLRQNFPDFQDAVVLPPSHTDDPDDIYSIDTEDGLKQFIEHNNIESNDVK